MQYIFKRSLFQTFGHPLKTLCGYKYLVSIFARRVISTLFVLFIANNAKNLYVSDSMKMSHHATTNGKYSLNGDKVFPQKFKFLLIGRVSYWPFISVFLAKRSKGLNVNFFPTQGTFTDIYKCNFQGCISYHLNNLCSNNKQKSHF